MSTKRLSSFTPDVPTWMLAVVGLGLLVLVVAGVWLDEYLIGLGITVLVVSLFAMSFNLLFGYTGVLSFGHAMFYGTGAYMLALILSGKVGFLPAMVQDSFLLAFAASVVITMILAAVVGVLCVQRGDIYFAMLTLAFSMMIFELAGQWRNLTGGSDGTIMPGTTVNLGFTSFDASSTVPYYYFTLVIVVVSIYLLWRVVNSPYGQLLKAIRENPERAEFVGINVKAYQWTAFVLSALFSGVAGALIAVRIFVISPDLIHWSVSAEPIIVTLIGGPSSFLGPFVGAVVFVGLEEVITDYTNYWQIALGFVLIPIVLFTRGGLVGVVTGRSSLRESVLDPVLNNDYLAGTRLSKKSREPKEEDRR